MENKKLRGEFTWIPWNKRKDRFGLPLPPRRSDHRRPLLWLARKELRDELGYELYLVNSSGECLDLVESKRFGFASYEDDIVSVEGRKHLYENVEEEAAVKIEEYDVYYDLEFILSLTIKIKSKRLGMLIIQPPLTKGGSDEMVLLWDTMEAGKSVKIKKCSEDD